MRPTVINKRSGTATACLNNASPSVISGSSSSTCNALSATIRRTSLLSAKSLANKLSHPFVSKRVKPIKPSMRISESVTSLLIDETNKAVYPISNL
jgi:hypothetical protein